jgi:hypothetical protein
MSIHHHPVRNRLWLSQASRARRDGCRSAATHRHARPDPRLSLPARPRRRAVRTGTTNDIESKGIRCVSSILVVDSAATPAVLTGSCP